MPDKTRVFESLERIEETLRLLLEGSATIQTLDELLATPEGMLKLRGICMSLFVVGEEVKNLDKHSEKLLLPKYPSIPWSAIMKTRDIIAHHYFDVDAERIFDTLRNDIPNLLSVVRQMKIDWSNFFIP